MMCAMPEIVITLLSLGFLGASVMAADQLQRLLQGGAAVLLLGMVGLFFWPPLDVLDTGSFIVLDLFSRTIIQGLWACTAILFLLFGLSLGPDRLRIPEIPALVLFSLLGMMILAGSRSFPPLIVGMELMTLPIFVLAALRRDDKWTALGAVKYVILTGLATALLLYGIVLIWAATGSLDFSTFWSDPLVLKTPLFQVGLLLTLVGIFFKLGVVPFHWWVPDVYRTLPWSVVAFMTTLPKTALLAILLLFLGHEVIFGVPHLQDMISGIAMLSMTIGALGALRERNLRSWFAYAGMNQLGYMLIGVAVGIPKGFIGVLSYLAIYLVMMLGFWGMFLTLPLMGKRLESVDDLRRVQQKAPWRAFGMSLLLFSLAGLPPFAGFFVKIYLLEVALTRGHLPLVLVGALTSVLAAFYYLRLIRMLVMGPKTTAIQRSALEPQKAVNIFVLFSLLTLGFFWTPWSLKGLKILGAVITPLF